MLHLQQALCPKTQAAVPYRHLGAPGKAIFLWIFRIPGFAQGREGGMHHDV